MPAKTLVYISECDNIYNTKRVLPYLQAHGVRTHVLAGHMHGGWMGDPRAMAKILDSLHLSQLTSSPAPTPAAAAASVL